MRWPLLLLLTACTSPLPPDSPSVWGLSYTAVEVEPGSLGDGQYRALASRDTVRIERDAVTTFRVAHEVTHVWQKRHYLMPAAFLGAACSRQPDWNCTPTEAHADAVGEAAVLAGCGPGDFGWPGGEVTGCALPNPLEVHP